MKTKLLTNFLVASLLVACNDHPIVPTSTTSIARTTVHEEGLMSLPTAEEVGAISLEMRASGYFEAADGR